MTWLFVRRFAERRIVQRFSPAIAALACGAVVWACYNASDGTAPPPQFIYFPVGVDVSPDGKTLYVANSDFDLQYNGGTIQAYDLGPIRHDILAVINNPSNPECPEGVEGGVSSNDQCIQGRRMRPADSDPQDNPCTNPIDGGPVYRSDQSGLRQPIGETCAPPIDSSSYLPTSVTSGAFATDLQLIRCVQPASDPTALETTECAPGVLPAAGSRLYVPVRGTASVTWADVNGTTLDCGQAANQGRCDDAHTAGNNALEPGNSRALTMPGEPFGMAFTPDGTAILVTHQSTGQASLLTSGFDVVGETPALEFILDNIPTGGVGAVAVPHDPAACLDGTCQFPRPAFLWTTNAAAEIHLFRYYSDDATSTNQVLPITGTQSDAGSSGPELPPTLYRPFIVDEQKIPLTANSVGTDSRGVVIDRTPRLACKAKVRAATSATDPTFNAQMQVCARLPANVFVANRTPPSLLVGQIGDIGEDGSYDADLLTFQGNIPLSAGPSKLYLAPIVDQLGNYALRVFIVCFDSQQLFIYNPDTQEVENIIRTQPGPFAMAFDPFNMEDVAARNPVPTDAAFPDPNQDNAPTHKYRFAYLASFTQSFIQVLDLDNSGTNTVFTDLAHSTFETPVFTLGGPSLPKGTN